MQTRRRLFACAVAFAAMQCLPAHAGPGDVFVPAHRTRDGSYVPANVPTTSGGTHASTRPRRLGTGPAQPRTRTGGHLPPLFTEARPIRR